MPSGLLQIDFSGTSEEFRRGFEAAAQFLQGGDMFQIAHGDANSLTLELQGDHDNRSFVIDEEGVVRFDSIGVEL